MRKIDIKQWGERVGVVSQNFNLTGLRPNSTARTLAIKAINSDYTVSMILLISPELAMDLGIESNGSTEFPNSKDTELIKGVLEKPICTTDMLVQHGKTDSSISWCPMNTLINDIYNTTKIGDQSVREILNILLKNLNIAVSEIWLVLYDELNSPRTELNYLEIWNQIKFLSYS